MPKWAQSQVVEEKTSQLEKLEVVEGDAYAEERSRVMNVMKGGAL